MTESGKSPRRLTNSRGIDTDPTFSPDGRSIAFTSDRAGFHDLYLVDRDGRGGRLTSYTGGVFDGRYVYFSPYYNGTQAYGEVLRYDTIGD